jgi:hypothetical protein
MMNATVGTVIAHGDTESGAVTVTKSRRLNTDENARHTFTHDDRRPVTVTFRPAC